MQVDNKRLKELNNEKHELLRTYEKNEIKENTFKKQLNELEIKIKQLINEIINDEVLRIKEKNIKKLEEIKMAEEVKAEAKTEVKAEVKRGAKEQSNSYASVVAKVLSMKTIKNMDEAIAKVEEIKPGMEKPKIKGRVNAIIYAVKKQKQERWKKYTWDQEAFLLSEK